ncbi:hypothetical protein [Streptomyces beihaiensis]|uniref:Uncharacterized protein n=1 Tax=Streptomyces beihaiensis TaxID=2984495 RepID=A0ABT3U7W1_9ACTN|nr:hypothetical protein [Streptomyces beihaiensis]MCX3064270.1 hypothetical protein [Streptomyces beihaiensis]
MTSTQRGRTTSMRQTLRREVAGTIGLLADEQDFEAMRRYRSFAFDDHKNYLRSVEGLLKSVAAAGGHTTIALFDPEEYARFCADTGLDPDTPASRTRFTAELAAAGPALLYEGQPLADLLPELVEEAVRRATWQYAATVLVHLGTCAVCGQDIGRAAFVRASYLVARVIDTIGRGTHQWVCSATTDGARTLHAVLHVDASDPDTVTLDETAATELATVLAVAIATKTPCALVLRTSAPGHDDRVYGWHLADEELRQLTAAQVFDAYCTDAATGELTAPEPGVDYCAAPPIEAPSDEGRHRH